MEQKHITHDIGLTYIIDVHDKMGAKIRSESRFMHTSEKAERREAIIELKDKLVTAAKLLFGLNTDVEFVEES